MIISKLDWDDNDRLAREIIETQEDRLSSLRDFHNECWLNILWALVGRQDVFYDRYSKQLLDLPPPEEHRVRLITNLLYPQVRRNIAKLAKKPIWDVLAATSDQDDINTAILNTKVLQAYWRKLRMPIKWIEMLSWLCSTGNAILKCGWDTKAGPSFTLTDEERSQVLNATGKRAPKTIQLGEAYIEVPSFFSVTWQPGVELYDSEWVIHTKLRSKDYITKRYNLKEFPNFDSFGSKYFDMKLMSMLESYQGVDDMDKCVTHEFFSDEKYVFLVGNKVMKKGKNPYGENPFVHFKEQNVPGSPLAMSTVKMNRSSQAHYNKIRSWMVEVANLMGAPKILSPATARLRRDAISNKPGEIIEYEGMIPPKIMNPPTIPAFIQGMMYQTKADMQDVGSIHNVSEAKVDPGMRSGHAIATAQDADDSILGPVMQMADEGLKELGRKLLNILHKNIDEPRLLKIVGDSHIPEILTFTGRDLVGKNNGLPDIDYFDVIISSYSQYPMSRVGMEQRVDWMLQRGLLDPAKDRERILSFLGSGDVAHEFSDNQKHKARANEENYRMSKGKEVKPLKTERHDIHMAEHDEYINIHRDELEQNGQLQMFMMHRDEHENLAAFLMVNKEVLLQQAAQQLMGQPMPQEANNARPSSPAGPAGRPNSPAGRGSGPATSAGRGRG